MLRLKPAFDHPLQIAIRKDICRAAGISEDDGALSQHGIDGCGVPTYALPLHTMARMYASFGCGDDADAAVEQRLLGCMRAFPEMIAGEHEFDTRISRVTGGR